MFYNTKVKIPVIKGKVYHNPLRGVTYINYEYDRKYIPEKKYNIPKRTTIGKTCEDDPTMMYPNANYVKYFPDAVLPTDNAMATRSSCLRIGAYLVVRNVIEECGLDDMIRRIIGKDSGLFLDLVAYSIITENNAGQYYPEYAYNHPLFTGGMKIYSDSKVSEFLNGITADQATTFLNEWNDARDHRERIYISYDSTNKSCQAGEIEIAEFGNPKNGQGKPVFNYSVAYDRNNREPLFYEEYPGSIVDVSQLQHMLEKAKGYGYRRVGFILDRGYFSEANINYMDRCGYDFVIMAKGLQKIVSGLVLENKGAFEESREHGIREYRVSGMTVRQRLFEADEEERYFHIYYSSHKYAAEREAVEIKVDRIAKYLSKQEGKSVRIEKSFEQYFDPFYFHEGQNDEYFMFGIERKGVVEKEIRLCGYFAIITSKEMTAREALCLYKSRDASEKLFRGDKSFLGNGCLRVHSDESADAKIFVEFVALIVRNRIYTRLKDEMEKNDQRPNYMTVPAAIKELEKIEMVRLLDNVYRLDHAVTAIQKFILSAFGIDANHVKNYANEISEKLADLSRIVK